MLKKVRLYSDGAARGNPDGPGGYGAILQYTDKTGNLHEKEISEGFVKTTNNRMELLGVIAGLECLRVPCEVDVYSDSKYVVSAFNENWVGNWQKNGWKTASRQPVKNKELWDRLLPSIITGSRGTRGIRKMSGATCLRPQRQTRPVKRDRIPDFDNPRQSVREQKMRVR